MSPVGQSNRGRSAADLLHRDAMREIAHTSAAIFFLDSDPVQTERAHFRPQLDREAVGAVDLGGDRCDPVFGKAANRRPQHVDLRIEIKIERGEPRILHYCLVIPGHLRRVDNPSNDALQNGLAGAVEKTRTSTEFPPQRPQRCASTNSATTARRAGVISKSGRLYQGRWTIRWERSGAGSSGASARRPSTIRPRWRKWNSGSLQSERGQRPSSPGCSSTR